MTLLFILMKYTRYTSHIIGLVHLNIVVISKLNLCRMLAVCKWQLYRIDTLHDAGVVTWWLNTKSIGDLHVTVNTWWSLAKCTICMLQVWVHDACIICTIACNGISTIIIMMWYAFLHIAVLVNDTIIVCIVACYWLTPIFLFCDCRSGILLLITRDFVIQTLIVFAGIWFFSFLFIIAFWVSLQLIPLSWIVIVDLRDCELNRYLRSSTATLNLRLRLGSPSGTHISLEVVRFLQLPILPNNVLYHQWFIVITI